MLSMTPIVIQMTLLLWSMDRRFVGGSGTVKLLGWQSNFLVVAQMLLPKGPFTVGEEKGTR